MHSLKNLSQFIKSNNSKNKIMNHENAINSLKLNLQQVERQLTDPSLTKEQKEALAKTHGQMKSELSKLQKEESKSNQD